MIQADIIGILQNFREKYQNVLDISLLVIYIYTVLTNGVGGAVYLTLMSYHHLLTKPGDAKI